ncbi:spermidine/putrescine transport system ATP-binding protein [Mesorhizobium soli]|uniref:ABC transporter ATP-binding protein n=1 Tax=Pseudaminobacter soli (ex Li et al. 2025) TaxID=1295366 RepID=UPI0024758B29|nr:ABC transporter ATP-binding protein [Mesorhizobium soli]MDH6231576.1 spermidine/putrescine transport system ATP-binding protein [Mesorhizobium soli]
MNAPLVDVRNVSHRFGQTSVLHDLSLRIEAGSYTVLLGPSGSGKTTLLSILGGFVVPTEGNVFIRGQDCTAVPPAKRPTTTVFQDYALFPHMSIGKNVAFGLRMRGVDGATRAERARTALKLVGLADAFDRRPHQLSGGQRQRVALARALVVEPAVLLLDEPLGALDLKLRRQMQDELKALQKSVGTAFVHVTHDQEEAMALADHCVVMNEGRIEDEGAPERVYSQPVTRFSATFMGESTVISGTVTDFQSGMITLRTPVGNLSLPGEATPGSAFSHAIRPEHLLLGEPAGAVGLGEAVVGDVVFQGSFRRVLATSKRDPGIVFLARLATGSPVAPGDIVAVSCRPEHIIRLKD